MIKLVVSDVDGTLVNDGGNRLNPLIFEAINKLYDKGIKFVVASGRSYTSLLSLFEPVKDKIIFCCQNGSYVRYRNIEIMKKTIDSSFIEGLIADSEKISDIVPCICKPEVMIVKHTTKEAIDWLVEGYKTNLDIVDDITKVDFNNVVQFSILDLLNVEENSVKKLNKKWWDLLTIAESGDNWLDMTAKNVSKGDALSEILKYLNLDFENVVAFGDNHNDLSMLKRVKYSFAVSNARKEVIDISKYITKSNNEDGVLIVLNKILEGDYDFNGLV